MQSWFYDCIKYLCMCPVHFCLFNWYITNLRSQIRFDVQSAWICEWYSKRNKSHSIDTLGTRLFPAILSMGPIDSEHQCSMNEFLSKYEYICTCFWNVWYMWCARAETYSHFGVYTIKSKATERKDWMFTKLLTVKLSMWLCHFETQTQNRFRWTISNIILKSNGRSPTRICT